MKLIFRSVVNGTLVELNSFSTSSSSFPFFPLPTSAYPPFLSFLRCSSAVVLLSEGRPFKFSLPPQLGRSPRSSLLDFILFDLPPSLPPDPIVARSLPPPPPSLPPSQPTSISPLPPPQTSSPPPPPLPRDSSSNLFSPLPPVSAPSPPMSPNTLSSSSNESTTLPNRNQSSRWS